jgi:transposase InsO family protein
VSIGWIPQSSFLRKASYLTKSRHLLFHSDRGVQYACDDFTKLLKTYECTQSMSRKGNCWDNAVAESFFKTLKVECLNKYIFNNQNMLNNIVFRYIDGWYNTVRIHSTLGGISPLSAFKQKSLCLAA